MSGKGSTTIRRQLARKLVALRKAAGKETDDVVASGIVSATKLWRLENAKIPVKQGDVWALCNLYGARSDVTSYLADMARGTSGDWFEEFSRRKTVPEWVGTYVGLEQDASHITAFHPTLVFGLLQTPEYARAVIHTQPELDEQVVAERLAFRLQRQQRVLDRPTPARVRALLGAGALELLVGSRDVMQEQRTHLLRLEDREAVSIRVVPWEAGAYGGTYGAFTLLNFADPDDPEAVHVESLIGTKYLELPEEVTRFKAILARLDDSAVSIKEYLA